MTDCTPTDETPPDPRPDDETPLDPRLAELLARLPRTAEPPQAQWTSIASRIASPEMHGGAGATRIVRSSLPPWARFAAAAVLILAAGWWLAARGGLRTRDGIADRGSVATPSSTEPPAVMTGVPDGATEVVLHHDSTVFTPTPDAAALDRALAARTDLDEATVAALRRNMAVIDSALADSRRALARNPGDRDVDALVRFAESQRRELLAQLQRLHPS